MYHQADRDKAVGVGMAFLYLFAALLLIVAIASCSVENNHKYATADALDIVYTSDSEIPIRVFTFIDPDSGIMYLVSDRGGITPRLNHDGEIIVVGM